MKNLRKKFVMCFCVVCMMVLLHQSAWAIALSFDPSFSSVGVGNQINVDIIVSGLANDDLAAFDLNVSYDNTILDFGSYAIGNELGYIDNFDAEDWSLGDLGNGTIHLSELSWLWDFSSQADTFTLATLSFISENIDNSALSFSDVILSNEWGEALYAETESGHVNVSATPEPASLLLLSSGLLGFATYRRKIRNKLETMS